MTLTYGSLYTESGASWTDNFDGMGIIATASSGSVNTGILGIYILTYTHTDIAGNTGNIVTRIVTVADQISPIVTLSGATTFTIIQNDPYTELGASWTDNRDGSGTILIASSGSVNTAILGTYVLSYTYTDMAGNSGNTITRTISVGPPPPDTTLPVVTLIGSTSRTILFGSVYSDL